AAPDRAPPRGTRGHPRLRGAPCGAPRPGGRHAPSLPHAPSRDRPRHRARDGDRSPGSAGTHRVFRPRARRDGPRRAEVRRSLRPQSRNHDGRFTMSLLTLERECGSVRETMQVELEEETASGREIKAMIEDAFEATVVTDQPASDEDHSIQTLG